MTLIPMQAKKCKNGQTDIPMDKLGPRPTQCQETPTKLGGTQHEVKTPKSQS